MRYWKFVNKVATETGPESVELRIVGDIIDDDDVWLYDWFKMAHASPNAFRAELVKYKGKPITVWIDSYGGNVFAAAGMYNALKEHDAKVTVKIDGKAMSAATIIAMAGAEVLMSPVAIFMIHNPLTEVYGYASDMRKTAEVLDVVKETIINAYQLKTKKPRDKISELMDDESYMSAKTAIKEGFADGMLYEDKTVEAQNFAFARHTVNSSTNEAIKKIMALQKPDNEILKARLALELETL